MHIVCESPRFKLPSIKYVKTQTCIFLQLGAIWRTRSLCDGALITVVITVVETEEKEDDEDAVVGTAATLLLKKRACGWNGRAAGKPMIGDFMAMPMGTGPSRDDLFEAAKN